MYKIQKETKGNLTVFNLTFSGFIKQDEMHRWVEDSKKELASVSGEFVVNVDMTEMKPLPADAQKEMQSGQKLYREKGLKRSAVLINSAVTKMQFERIAKETGLDEYERYFSSEEPNYEISINDWLTKEDA